MSFTCTAEARIDGAVPDDLLARLAAELAEHGLVCSSTPDGLAVEQTDMILHVALRPAGLTVRLGAPDTEALLAQRARFLHMMDHADPVQIDRLVWSGNLTLTDTPPNLRFAQVVSVTEAHGNYLRLTLTCDRIKAFTATAMHFRLLLPPQGRAPLWPRQDPSGRTVWPTGPDALHRPAYTFVDIDLAREQFSFDLFRHDGGRATQWALAAQPGDAVTLMGPGGGQFPPGDWLLMGGDETALPAIRRILQHSAPSRTGAVVVETADPADQTDLPAPPGMTVTWLTRGQDAPLIDRLCAVPIPPEGHSRFVWLGAEKHVVRAARAHFQQDQGLSKTETYFSAYWTAA